jgi:hypothetical protein
VLNIPTELNENLQYAESGGIFRTYKSYNLQIIILQLRAAFVETEVVLRTSVGGLGGVRDHGMRPGM